MVDNSVFYIDFYSWTDVLLRCAYEEWRRWSLIFNLWQVYDSCTVLTSFSQRCFWECYASLGQQKLWITVLQEKLEDLDGIWRWWYFSLSNGLASEMSQPNVVLGGSQHLYVLCLAVLPALRFFYHYTNNVSAVSSWIGNERQTCQWLRTLSMIGQWKWLKWLLLHKGKSCQ